MNKLLRSGVWLAPLAFALDRVTKLWASRTLVGGASLPFWPGVLRFVYVENTGAAFGLLRERQAFLSVLSALLVVGLVVFVALRGGRMPLLPRWSLWLMAGGASGNLYDRVTHGYVIDFIDVELFRFAVFNVADICVTVAFVLLAGWILFGGEAKARGG